MAMNLLFTLLLLVALVVTTNTYINSRPLDQHADPAHDVVAGACPVPSADAAAAYAVVTGFPTLLLAPADGWICRCVLLETPLCTCDFTSVFEDDLEIMPETLMEPVAPESSVYFGVADRSHHPELVLEF